MLFCYFCDIYLRVIMYTERSISKLFHADFSDYLSSSRYLSVLIHANFTDLVSVRSAIILNLCYLRATNFTPISPIDINLLPKITKVNFNREDI